MGINYPRPGADVIPESPYLLPRRGGRAVECGGLENRCGCKLTVGSNPTPSAEMPAIRLTTRFLRVSREVLTTFLTPDLTPNQPRCSVVFAGIHF
jgi:hypothetical protein